MPRWKIKLTVALGFEGPADAAGAGLRSSDFAATAPATGRSAGGRGARSLSFSRSSSSSSSSSRARMASTRASIQSITRPIVMPPPSTACDVPDGASPMSLAETPCWMKLSMSWHAVEYPLLYARFEFLRDERYSVVMLSAAAGAREKWSQRRLCLSGDMPQYL